MSKLLFVLLTLQLVTIEVVRVAVISLTINPEHVRVKDDPQSVSFTCAADLALAGCQFRWRDYNNKPGPLLELSRGSQSRADPAHLDTTITGYSYSGRGLGAGDCGVSLQLKSIRLWMVACRVRAESGGWTYAWADLYATSYEPIPHNLVTPREVVVLPGGEARFSLEAREPLDICYFNSSAVSAGELYFDQGPKSPDSIGRHLYVGAGLQSGQCGLALTNVSKADNGLVRCFIRTPLPHKSASRFMALVVARPPTAPTLSLTYTGTNVTATCAVQGSRPVAMISWVLGDDIIRQDENDDTQASALDEWRWPWLQGSIQQTLTLQLQPEHNGKDLKCRVSHIALAQPLEAKSTVSFVEPTMSTTPVTTTSPTPMTTPCITTSTTPMTTPCITTSTTPGQKCIAANILELDLLCQENRLQATQLANTSCANDEVYAFHVREAGAAARTAEVLEEAARAHARAEGRTAEVMEEVAKAEKTAKSLKAGLEMEAAQVSLEAARAHARAEARTAVVLEEAVKAEKTAKALKAELEVEVTKVSLDDARAHARAEARTAEVLEEVANVSLKASRAHARAKSRTAEVLEEFAKAEKTAKAAAAEKAMNAAEVTYKLAEDTAKVSLEAAKVSLEAARASARAEAELEAEVAKVSLEAARAHARAEEAWAKNAEEELQYERERRART